MALRQWSSVNSCRLHLLWWKNDVFVFYKNMRNFLTVFGILVVILFPKSFDFIVIIPENWKIYVHSKLASSTSLLQLEFNIQCKTCHLSRAPQNLIPTYKQCETVVTGLAVRWRVGGEPLYPPPAAPRRAVRSLCQQPPVFEVVCLRFH